LTAEEAASILAATSLAAKVFSKLFFLVKFTGVERLDVGLFELLELIGVERFLSFELLKGFESDLSNF
jgi:hypothetical protein